MTGGFNPLFQDIVHRTRLTGQMRCETALRVGAGKNSLDALETNLPVMKGADGQPFLPGSSLKGVLRSQVEAILRAQATPENWKQWACDPISQSGRCIPDDPKTIDESREEKSLSSTQRGEAARALVRDHSCRACQIFGAPGLGAHVLLSDARLSPEQGPVRTEIRDSVAIDRDLGRAADKRKYDFEVVPAGALFDLRILIMDLPADLEGALVLGIQMLEEGFARVGGFKSRGLGQVSLQKMTVQRSTIEKGKLTARELKWDQYKTDRGAAFDKLAQEVAGA